MPLEIKELHIKATIGDKNQNAGNAPDGQGDSGDKDAIIQACIEKVMQMLKDKDIR